MVPRTPQMIAAAVVGLLQLAACESTTRTTCEKIAATTGINIEWPLTPPYQADQALYWSGSCSALLPSCILVPKNSSELATIVKTLQTNKEIFAVKSGGHNPNTGFASISSGPLISLKAINHATYDAPSKTASIGPGNRWVDVARALEPHGVAVASGRVGHVGVGGYMAGGGLSFLSTQHGWAMNTVVEYEVVLASGKIVTASATKHSDLFKALKGGGNNFGIVTSYKLNAFPIGTIWAGQLIFLGEDKANGMLSAVRNFTEHYPDDRAAIIVTSAYNTTDSSTIWIVFLFWDGPTPPAGLFDDIFALGPVVNPWGPTTYANFIDVNGNSSLSGHSIHMSTETTPLPDASVGLDVFGSYWDYYIATSKKYSHIPGLVSFLTWQPIPRRLAAHAVAKGGDLLALDAEHDRVMWELHFMTESPSTDAAVIEASKEMYMGLRSIVDAYVQNGLLKDVYRPLFMNDAHATQDYFRRLKPTSRSLARAVRDKYDPSGFFRDRTGGFKL